MRSTSTPADRKVRDILVRIIETMHDESQRELARDLLLTLPPVRDWPHDTLRAAYEPFTFAPPRQELGSSPQQWQAGEPFVEVRRGPARRPQVCVSSPRCRPYGHDRSMPSRLAAASCSAVCLLAVSCAPAAHSDPIPTTDAAIIQIAQTTLRNIVEQHSQDEVLAETSVINGSIREILDTTTVEGDVEVTGRGGPARHQVITIATS